MSSVHGGLEAVIREHAPKVYCVLTTAHSLNFILNHVANHNSMIWKEYIFMALGGLYDIYV